MPNSPLERYLALVEDVDRRVQPLFERYASYLHCRRGCYYCCDAITVLPIELEALRRWLEHHGTFPSPPGTSKRCAFLGRADECTVYGGRPVICRTHGLPLAYRVYEYDMRGREINPDQPEYTDLWCDLNFVSLDDEAAVALFDASGRINMDEINRAIEELNEAFLGTDAGRPYRGLQPGENRFALSVLLR